MTIITLVVDGARPDTLGAAMLDGTLPAIARMRDEGSAGTLTSVFPSVTGPAYTPFLMGRHPGAVGLPGLRWMDRSRRACRWPSYSRSYVGSGMRHVDSDLDPSAPTLFELAPSSLGALSVITRGLPRRARIGAGPRFAARVASTHFRGDLDGWLAIDRAIAAELVSRVARDSPAYVFAALAGVDKASHAEGHTGAAVRAAMRIADDTVGELRDELVRRGRWDASRILVVSDHGHSPVDAHDDLADAVAAMGVRPLAHPFRLLPGAGIAVMVSGNAMAHMYVELERRERPLWDVLRDRWEPLVTALLARASVDLVLLPLRDDSCEVRARGRGRAMVRCDGARYTYVTCDGDPLGIGDVRDLDAHDAHAATAASNYPDSLVQIAHIASSARSGDIILSAARGWDFRGRYEPIPHVSSHGAMHRDHMLVPVVTSHPLRRPMTRTVDVMGVCAAALGLAPAGEDAIPPPDFVA